LQNVKAAPVVDCEYVKKQASENGFNPNLIRANCKSAFLEFVAPNGVFSLDKLKLLLVELQSVDISNSWSRETYIQAIQRISDVSKSTLASDALGTSIASNSSSCIESPIVLKDVPHGFLPFTDDEDLLFNDTLAGSHSDDKVMVRKFGIPFKCESLCRLRPVGPVDGNNKSCWLDDDPINLLFNHVATGPTRLVLNSFFFSAKLQKGYDAHARRELHATASRQCLSMSQVAEFFIPLHYPSHWAFAYINACERKIFVFDSLRSDKKFQTAKERLLTITAVELPALTFECVNVDCPQQSNGVDCGVFALMFMLMCSQGKDLAEVSLSVKQKYMNYFRQYLLLKVIAIESGIFSLFS